MNQIDKMHLYLAAIGAMLLGLLMPDGHSGPFGWTVYGIVLGWLTAGYWRTVRAMPKPKRVPYTRSHRQDLFDVELD